MSLDILRQVSTAINYASIIERENGVLRALLDEQSQVIAALVASHGGMISSELWDSINAKGGFWSYKKRASSGGVEIVMGECKNEG